jgi:AcrR family transcriptional regulator
MKKLAGSRAQAAPTAIDSTRNRPAPAVEREPRGARRKRETRERLFRAAFRLLAERGVDGVAINEITEAADVGFGSFYNRFTSKEALHEALFEEVVTRNGPARPRGRWLNLMRREGEHAPCLGPME